ncbi:MAG TPA: hypothetical protein VF821_19980 [Lentzea sp.]
MTMERVRAARSLHRDSADLMAEKWAQSERGAIRLARSYLMLRDENLARNIDVFGQPYGDWDMGQLFSLYCLARLYSAGRLAVAEFDLPASPKGDAKRRENQEVLHYLPKGVVAEVDQEQRGAEGDGQVEWSRRIRGWMQRDEKDSKVVLSPNRAVLEIGYTDASNTCLQLMLYGAVARWPYGHKKLYVVALRPKGVEARWKSRPPSDPIVEDLVTFWHQISLSRLSRTTAWGVRAPRPPAEVRLAKLRQSGLN